jgi:predicted acyl esterase
VTGGNAAREMLVERDVEIPMPDGIILAADVFRPAGGSRSSHLPFAGLDRGGPAVNSYLHKSWYSPARAGSRRQLSNPATVAHADAASSPL